MASEAGRLILEPLVERDCWIIEIRTRKLVETRTRTTDDAFAGGEPMTFEAFKREFIAPGGERRLVPLRAESPAAAGMFREWRAEVERKHG